MYTCSVCVCVSRSVVTDSLQPHCLSMEFFRQKYWSGLPFPSPGDLPDPGIEPATFASPALASGFFATSTTWDINNLTYADDTTLMAESEEELKSLLMKLKEETEKATLKPNIKNEDHGIWS